MHADRHTSRWVYTMFWTLTCINMVCGLYKKKRYVKPYFDKHNG